MIIQCGQCRTKYRFADDLMEGDGIWMRCSRCQHVFFQDNPQNLKPVSEPTEKAYPVSSGDEKAGKAKINSDQELFPEIEKPVSAEGSKEASTEAFELNVENDKQQVGKSSLKGFRKVLVIILWIIAVIVIIPAIFYYFLFPQIGDRLLKLVNQYVDIGIHETVRPEIVVGQVKLQDIRQRILNNFILGPIRIVEGMAVNQADYPVSRINIKGEIVDVYAVVLGERTAYAGNVLTDEELTTLPEEEILKMLARPEGSNNSNDKIMPNGMIPFMIVFTREPAGVIKTTVKTVGAERLL